MPQLRRKSVSPHPGPEVTFLGRGRTLRVSLIPLRVTEDEFRTFLRGLVGGDFILSLAPSRGFKVATVTFTHREPPALSKCARGDRSYLRYEDMSVDLVVDCDFLGMTPLYSAENPTVDIIAVTGLAGHAYGSWKSRTQNQMWLRDFLPSDLPNVRILTFGYDSTLRDSTSTGSIQQFSRAFLDGVNSERTGEKERNRPIIFIGHSFGGLIIKQALADASMSGGSENDQAILSSCTGLFFFGVPNRGLNVENLRTLVMHQTNAHLVNDLREGSELLRHAYQHFLQGFTHKDCQITSFYELRDTKAVIVREDGSWERSGGMIRVVSQESATFALPTEAIHMQVPIDADHSNMVKFADKADPNYIPVRDRLSDYVAKAPGILETRLASPAAARGGQPKVFQKDEQECIRSLSFPEIDSRQQAIKGGHDDTCAWLLQHPNYREWLDRERLNEHRGLIWIKGKPGAGKSTLMKHALEHYRQRASGTPVAILGFFFNARGGHLEKTLLGLFRSLFHQLLQQVRPLLSEFLPKFQEKQTLHQKGWEWHQTELEGFFRTAITRPQAHPIVVFVDGLDECDEPSARRFVWFLGASALSAVENGANLSICLSSRHYPNIHLKDCPEIRVEDCNESDISKYVRTTLSLAVSDESSLALVDTILRNASGVFLWVVLVVNELVKAQDDGESMERMKQILQDTPPELEELFKQSFQTIRPDDRPRALQIMQWVLFAERPLTLTELRFALASDEAPNASQQEWQRSDRFVKEDKQMEKLARSLSRGLVEVKTVGTGSATRTIVQFIHESVRDFLQQRNGFEILDPSLGETAIGRAHDRLARSCSNYLNIQELRTADFQAQLYSYFTRKGNS
ncbi:hypothetical protein FN846DRAFT_929114 [Sphaerosporella brunnea]|uniref:Uncharacterized protein n=1 Tax=Sphaerosporella brunnea TaxID=1250544 RepID=A0A5J5FA66_9PEZI|nr:hypothetical protein FN846DRAFT_929114 [Sphaerosporella brunnea]